MSNLRILRIRNTSNTSFRTQFTAALDPLINTANVELEPLLPSIPVPQVLKVKVNNDLLNITTQPLTPFANYKIIFKSSETVRFKSLNGDQFLLEDDNANVTYLQAQPEPASTIKNSLSQYNEDNVYNLDGTNFVSHIIDSQDQTLSRALHDIGQAANDNYLEVLVTDERKIRGAGAYDRLNQEGAWEVVRVGKTKTGYPNSLSFSYDEFPRDVITLLRKDVVSERLIAGNGPSTFNGLVLTVDNNPVTKLTSVEIIYQNGDSVEYDVETSGYQMKNAYYDRSHASTLFTLEDNQFKLNEEVFDNTSPPPVAGDTVIVNYEYKSLGRQIDPASVAVTQVLTATREVAPPIITEFSLDHAPVVTEQDIIPSAGGIEFLNPRACVPFSEPHPAFVKEIPFRLGGLPAFPGEYAVDYENGRVFVYGESKGQGTGPFPPAMTYNYRKSYDSRLDYTYNPETGDLAASPIRELIGQPAKVSFNYEETLVPGIDYNANVHIEALDERVENRLATLTSLYTLHTPVTNVFRLINETTGEIYPVNRYNDTTVFFSANVPPRIDEIKRERANFADVLNELILVNSSFVNTNSTIVFQANLQNNRIINATEDAIGASFNTSAAFSRTDIFAQELYFDDQVLPASSSYNKLSVGDYVIDYPNGVVYVGVANTQNFDLGTINYKKPAIKTENPHIISVSKLYNSINPNSNVTLDINYNSFDDTEIFPSTFNLSDERFLNGDTSLPYIYDNGTITVTNDIKNVRGVYDVYDLNNNDSPINFASNSTWSANVITTSSTGINFIQSNIVLAGNIITVPFISPGMNVGSVNSVIRISDGAELWNSSGTISGYDVTLPGINSPIPGDEVVINYNLVLNGGSTPVVDYNRGDYFVDYTYLADELIVSYEYGDNVIDFREANSLNEGDEYFVTYKVGALRDSLFANFGTLVDLPIMSSFDTSFPRERYRDALQGALQSFTKGPTIPAMKQLVSSISKIDPQIIEAAFQVWSLGISSLYQDGIDYIGDPSLVVGKYDNGILIDQDGQTVTMPMSSNLRLEEGTLNFWFIPNWNGIDNDATLSFTNILKDGYELSASNIYIGADSHHPTIEDGTFSVSRFDTSDPKGLPSAIFTQNGMFIYFDEDEDKWKILVKDPILEVHQYTGKITTSGEFYDVKYIPGLGESNDILRSITNEIQFVWNVDGYDASSPDGYNSTDGYVPGYSFDGIMFMSDDKHYLFDFAEESTRNRFSIFKDGRGYLNFEIFDNGRNFSGVHEYKVSSDIQDWNAGEKHFISASWKIDTYERRDEMHLFIDGFEVPNILRFGGRPQVSLGDRWRTVKPEIVAGTIPKNVIKGDLLTTTVGSNVVYDPSVNFSANGILPGDTIDILEIGFGTFTITAVSGTTLTLNSPVSASFVDARYSVNKFSAIVSNEVELSENVAVYIVRDGVETEIPGPRAEFPSYTISKNSQLQTVLTILGPALVGDQVYIRTLGLNHRRCRQRMYLWSPQSILKTNMPPPISLDEVSVIPIILPLLSIGPANATIAGPTFVANGIVPTGISNTTEGRILNIRITGDNTNFSTPVSVKLTGTSDGGPTETLLFSTATNQLTLNKWRTITDVEVTVTPFTFGTTSTAIEIKEAFSITNPDGNFIFPIIRYSYQSNSGEELSGDGTNVVSGGFFSDTDVGNKIVIESPLAVVGTYTITEFISTSSVVVDPVPPAAFTNGRYKVYNATIGRSGFQNGFFTFEEAGKVGVSYPLPAGVYEFDYSSYLEIAFDNVQNQVIHIGSDFENHNPARGTIDDLTIFSRQLTDVRIGESLPPGQKSITTLYTALREFIPDRDTLVHISFNDFPLINNAPFYKLAKKEYLQSAESVNGEFGQSLVINERPYTVDNAGNLSTSSEGTIEFWVSPKFDTFNDPIVRYYFDAASAVDENTISLTSGTVKVSGRTNSVLSVRLQTDTENTGTNFFVGGSISDDFQTIQLGKPLPSQQTPVKITYVPIGYQGNRISIFKDNSGFLTFNVRSNDQDYQVRQPIFWQRDSWHRIKAMFKFNRVDNRDELRLFVDGRESGTIRFGQGFLFGSGIVFGQGIAGSEFSRLTTNIDFTDQINQFFIGSTFNKTNLAAARFDNLKISNLSINPLICSGVAVDENYQSNLNVALPVVTDLYTTLLLNFDQLLQKNDDFTILRDEFYGIFNFIINVIDSFEIVQSSPKVEQVLVELILALKPATSKVEINLINQNNNVTKLH